MQTDWAGENLQVIRTLMERASLYRRALAPIMLTLGALGLAGGVLGHLLDWNNNARFVGFWFAFAVLALAAAFLLARRQALKAEEPFWSPPTRRVALALLPALVMGGTFGVAMITQGAGDSVKTSLIALWLMMYGTGLLAAGFFVRRGIKLLGWVFLILGGFLLLFVHWVPVLANLSVHLLMGGTFGGLHLAYGIYLRFTEASPDPA